MGFSRWWEPCKEALCGREAKIRGRCVPCDRCDHRAAKLDTLCTACRLEIDVVYADLPGVEA